VIEEAIARPLYTQLVQYLLITVVTMIRPYTVVREPQHCSDISRYCLVNAMLSRRKQSLLQRTAAVSVYSSSKVYTVIFTLFFRLLLALVQFKHFERFIFLIWQPNRANLLHARLAVWRSVKTFVIFSIYPTLFVVGVNVIVITCFVVVNNRRTAIDCSIVKGSDRCTVF